MGRFLKGLHLTKKQFIVLAVIVIILAIVLVTLYLVRPELFSFLFPEETPNNQQNTNTNSTLSENIAFEAHFIDVAQGDAILIRFADGFDIMIDAGSATTGLSEIRAGVISYLASIQLDSIDCMVITHPDTDHYNIAEAVMDQYEVKRVILNNFPKNQTYTDFITRADEEITNNEFFDGIDADGQDYVITGSGYTVSVYAPGYDTLGNADSTYDASESNGMSPIVVVECGGRKLVLTGDAVVETEEWFIAKMGGTTYDCDFLKLGHHGSITSSSEAFIDYVDCEFGVVMVDDGTKHGHPDEEVMVRFNDRSIPTYTTNAHGNIILKVDTESNFAFFVEKDSPVLNNKDGLATHMEVAAAA